MEKLTPTERKWSNQICPHETVQQKFSFWVQNITGRNVLIHIELGCSRKLPRRNRACTGKFAWTNQISMSFRASRGLLGHHVKCGWSVVEMFTKKFDHIERRRSPQVTPNWVQELVASHWSASKVPWSLACCINAVHSTTRRGAQWNTTAEHVKSIHWESGAAKKHRIVVTQKRYFKSEKFIQNSIRESLLLDYFIVNTNYVALLT